MKPGRHMNNMMINGVMLMSVSRKDMVRQVCRGANHIQYANKQKMRKHS